MMYSILGQKTKIKGAIPECIERELSDFKEQTHSDEADIFVDVVDLYENEGLYGLSFLGREKLKSIHNMFFSKRGMSSMAYSEYDDYKSLVINVEKDIEAITFMELFMAGFYSNVALKNFLLLHASAVKFKDDAIVFTASSGTGKTTQAELWQRYRGADILNGDKVFISAGDAMKAWGSPWRGSSSYSKNDNAKIKAIVVLEQGMKNEIKKLNSFEAMEYFIPHVFFPKWDSRCEEGILQTLSDVLDSVDIYLLRCLPDEGSVCLLESTLY